MWELHDYLYIDDVFYTHSQGKNGMYAVMNILKDMMCSVVAGHTHTTCMLKYIVNIVKTRFGMQLGALVNWSEYAFRYQRNIVLKPVPAIGIVYGNDRAELVKMDTNKYKVTNYE